MKAIGTFQFPTTEQEADAWAPEVQWRAVHHRVLVHAHTRIEGAWSAYIFPVPGVDHQRELYLWKTEGSKLPEDVARVMFPVFKDVPYAR